jgi:hypothetical protein
MHIHFGVQHAYSHIRHQDHHALTLTTISLPSPSPSRPQVVRGGRTGSSSD